MRREAVTGLDVPETTIEHKQILGRKLFLQRIYREWYAFLLGAVPDGIKGAVLELGAGGGFLRELRPEVVVTDMLPVEGLSCLCSALALPFHESGLRAILMTNVLHHVPDVRAFFEQATVCVAPGGVIAMVEPWLTPWSRFVYGRLHHEVCAPDAEDWKFTSSGPLSGANEALPWIVFERDRRLFEQEFPQWRIEQVQPFMPVGYLLSGGFSTRLSMPGCVYGLCRRVEEALLPRRWGAMFAKIVLRRE